MQTPNDVHQFWFPAHKTIKEKLCVWFGKDPDFDRKIQDEFGDLVSEDVVLGSISRESMHY